VNFGAQTAEITLLILPSAFFCMARRAAIIATAPHETKMSEFAMADHAAPKICKMMEPQV